MAAKQDCPAWPTAGTAAYPATLFCSAPLPALQQAIAAACYPTEPPSLAPRPGEPTPALTEPGRQLAAAWAQLRAVPVLPQPPARAAPAPALGALAPLLELREVALRRLDGRLAVRGLSLALPAGAHLLITGPNGCGKSTLLKALCGLHPLEAGWVRAGGALLATAAVREAAAAAAMPGGGAGDGTGSGPEPPFSAAASAAGGGPALLTPPPLPLGPAALSLAAAAAAGGVMVVPQRPLAAPGAELWQQVVYPNTRRPPELELRRLLGAVGLGYLEGRAPFSLGGGSGGSGGGGSDSGEGGGAGDAAGGAWGVMLSPGELQRLSVARVLHR
jgi:energy-coupling factor transporter ATP-binding protein EcfA2